MGRRFRGMLQCQHKETVRQLRFLVNAIPFLSFCMVGPLVEPV